jgi:hypothetical protein
MLRLTARMTHDCWPAGTKDRCRLSGVCQKWRRVLSRPEYWQVRRVPTCSLHPSMLAQRSRQFF